MCALLTLSLIFYIIRYYSFYIHKGLCICASYPEALHIMGKVEAGQWRWNILNTSTSSRRNICCFCLFITVKLETWVTNPRRLRQVRDDKLWNILKPDLELRLHSTTALSLTPERYIAVCFIIFSIIFFFAHTHGLFFNMCITRRAKLHCFYHLKNKKKSCLSLFLSSSL